MIAKGNIQLYFVPINLRPSDEANMQVNDKDITVYAESCQSDVCEENCLKAVSIKCALFKLMNVLS